MKGSGFVRVRGFIFCAGVVLTPVLLAAFYQAGTTVQASRGNQPWATRNTASNIETSQVRKSVLVELVTSDECAACESAERLLTHLDRDQPVRDTDIIVLSEHVRHSDSPAPDGHLSATDPTRRQEDYQNLGGSLQPAPLFLINGVSQDSHFGIEEIGRAIADTAAEPVPLKLRSVRVRGNIINFALESGPDTPGYVNVYAALIAPTEKRSGMVEAFGRVGSSFRTRALGERPFMFQDPALESGGSLNGMRLVVFVQTKHIGPVVGSISCVLRPGMSATEETEPASFSSIPCPASVD